MVHISAVLLYQEWYDHRSYSKYTQPDSRPVYLKKVIKHCSLKLFGRVLGDKHP